jgi:hypothetical protein
MSQTLSNDRDNPNILKLSKLNEKFTKKTSLKDIILPDKYNFVITKLNKVSDQLNKLVINVYHFLKCWILKCYEIGGVNNTLPKITKDTIKLIFKILTVQDARGSKVSEDDKDLYSTLNEFYETEYSKLYVDEKMPVQKFCQLLKYITKGIVTNINNNIKLHFFNYLRCFVNGYFKSRHNNIILNAPEKDRSTLKYKFRRELALVKTDLIDGTLNSDVKYHNWINNYKNIILPVKSDESYELDLLSYPHKYLSKMIYMNRYLETLQVKQFHVLPLRSDKIIKYFTIETTILIDLMFDTDKDGLKYEITQNKDLVWRQFFKMDNCIFKKTGYNFSYMIQTDCFGVSILFSSNEKHNNDIKKYENRSNVRKKNTQDCSTKTAKEAKEHRAKLKKDREDKENLERIQKKRIKIQNKEAGKKLMREKKIKLAQEKEKEKEASKTLTREEKSKMAQEKKNEKERLAQEKKNEKERLAQEKKNEKERLDQIREEQNQQKLIIDAQKAEQKQINNQREFPTLEELTESQLNKLKSQKLVYIDPGKIRLYTMIDDEDTIVKYSNREYMTRIKRFKYSKKLTKLRKELGIIDVERTLEGFNSKSCYYNKFTDYVNQKNYTNTQLLESYKDKKFRQYRWYAYISKQREMDRFTNLISQKYGSNCKLLMGDWSRSTQMKHFISTPMIGLKRKLRKKFEIINVDEYNTSKLNYVTKEATTNLFQMMPEKIKKKVVNSSNIVEEPLKYKLTKIHSVLTYKMETGRMGCINRDVNAVKNMRIIAQKWLENRTRPEEYKRKSATTSIQKDESIKLATRSVKSKQVLDKSQVVSNVRESVLPILKIRSMGVVKESFQGRTCISVNQSPEEKNEAISQVRLENLIREAEGNLIFGNLPEISYNTWLGQLTKLEAERANIISRRERETNNKKEAL